MGIIRYKPKTKNIVKLKKFLDAKRNIFFVFGLYVFIIFGNTSNYFLLREQNSLY